MPVAAILAFSLLTVPAAKEQGRVSRFLDSVGTSNDIDTFTLSTISKGNEIYLFLKFPQPDSGVQKRACANSDSLAVFFFLDGRLTYMEVLRLESMLPAFPVLGKYFSRAHTFGKWRSKDGKTLNFVPIQKH
jgi:hypothetical protein